MAMYRSELREAVRLANPVPDVLVRYGVEIRRKRCRGFCHEGEDLNMAVSDDSCYCFVCGKRFDVFDVVRFFEKCSFAEALQKLNGEITFNQFLDAKNRTYERKKEQKERDRYFNLLLEWMSCDNIIRRFTPDGSMEKSLEYTKACARLPAIEYEINCLERWW